MLDAIPSTRLDSPTTALLPCGSYWAVAQSHVQSERWAYRNLLDQGFHAYLPLCWVIQRRHGSPFRTQVSLFGPYLFVALATDDRWQAANNTRGVKRLLLDTSGNPGVVPDTVVKAIRSAVDGAERLAASSPHWKPGTPCSLALGPLAGASAVVLSTHRDNATLAVLLFGALREVSAPIAWLTPRD